MTEGAEREQVCLLCKGPVGNAMGLDGFQLLHLAQDCPASPQEALAPTHASGSCKYGHWLHYECLEIIRDTLEECECSSFPCPDCQRSFKLPHSSNIQRTAEYNRTGDTNWKSTSKPKEIQLEELDVNNNFNVDSLDNTGALENCQVLLQEFQSLQSEVKSCETAVMSVCDLWQQSQAQPTCSSPVDSKNLHGLQRSYESIVEDFLDIQEAIKAYAETNQLL